MNEAKTGKYNMSSDEDYMAEMQENPDAPTLLRLYSWEPFAVSLGRNQRESDIDSVACDKKGYDIVRRPTGGRAVLHAREITYSLHIRLDESLHPQQIYRDVHLWIAQGLASLGARDIEFSQRQPNFRVQYQSMRSAACFASAARHELMWKGRKLVGSAQRITGNILLQHGSILLGSGHEEIVDVLRITDQEKHELRLYMLESSVSLEEITGAQCDFHTAADALLSVLQ